MQNYYIYKSRKQAVRLFLLASVLVLPSLWIISMGDTNWKAWIGIFFALAYPIALFNFFDRKPVVTLNAAGIYYKRDLGVPLLWQHINYVELITMSKQVLVRMHVPQQYMPPRKQGFMYKLGVALAEPMGYVENCIVITPTAANPQRLYKLIQAIMDANEAERDAILSREMNMITWKAD